MYSKVVLREILDGFQSSLLELCNGKRRYADFGRFFTDIKADEYGLTWNIFPASFTRFSSGSSDTISAVSAGIKPCTKFSSGCFWLTKKASYTLRCAPIWDYLETTRCKFVLISVWEIWDFCSTDRDFFGSSCLKWGSCALQKACLEYFLLP